MNLKNQNSERSKWIKFDQIYQEIKIYHFLGHHRHLIHQNLIK